MKRLINVDALLKELQAKFDRAEKDAYFTGSRDINVSWNTAICAIKQAPIVEAIPLDKPFLKMRYGDYVIYNKEWLLNHLQMEWNILQFKEFQPAIPIEWIRQWYKSRDYLSEGKTAICRMIWDWEKENG